MGTDSTRNSRMCSLGTDFDTVRRCRARCADGIPEAAFAKKKRNICGVRIPTRLGCELLVEHSPLQMETQMKIFEDEEFRRCCLYRVRYASVLCSRGGFAGKGRA